MDCLLWEWCSPYCACGVQMHCCSLRNSSLFNKELAKNSELRARNVKCVKRMFVGEERISGATEEVQRETEMVSMAF